MRVKEYMTPDPATVGEDASIVEAAELMKQKKVRRFPVLRGDQLIGIVTDRDLRSAAPSGVFSFDDQERQLMPELHSMLSKVKIREIMSSHVVRVDSEQTIVAAAQQMLRHRISGLPVVDSGGALVGIITETDIFKALVDLSGASSGNTSLAFQLEDRPGSIKEVADVIRAHGGQLESILTSNTLAETGFRRVYLRIRDLPSDQMRALESELEGRFDLLYLIQEDPSTA